MNHYCKATKKVLWQNIFYMYMNKCFHIMKTYIYYLYSQKTIYYYIIGFTILYPPQAVKYHA